MMERKYYIIIIIIGMGSYYDSDSDVEPSQPFGGHTFHTRGTKLMKAERTVRKILRWVATLKRKKRKYRLRGEEELLS